MSFSGFSTDDPIKLPAELFEQVLPAIVQPAELKVTLHFFFLLRASRRRPRMVEWSDLRGDKTLRKSLRAVAPHRPFEEVLLDGLAATVHRGTLLHVTIPDGPRVGNWYLANTERNRTLGVAHRGRRYRLAAGAGAFAAADHFYLVRAQYRYGHADDRRRAARGTGYLSGRVAGGCHARGGALQQALMALCTCRARALVTRWP